MTQSPELTGGQGFTFEALVDAYYLVALLCETNAPSMTNAIVKQVALQQSAFGEPLDDLIVDGEYHTGESMRVSLQIKRSLTISSAKSNGDFRDVIVNSWLTYKKETFRRDADRYGVVTGTIADSAFRNASRLCELARQSVDEASFFQRFQEDGNEGKVLLQILYSIREILDENIVNPINNNDVYGFIKHFVFIKMDFLHEGAKDPVQAISQLGHVLAEQHHGREAELWSKLTAVAHEGMGHSAIFTRASLTSQLLASYRFAGASSLRSDLDKISQYSKSWLEDIRSDINGYTLSRQEIIDKVAESAQSYRFVQINGLPGTGKSAVLKQYAISHIEQGPFLFLSSLRLTGKSWAVYANSIGLDTTDIALLLSEIEVTGTAILFIDGIDRLQPDQRPIVLDIINEILTCPDLSNWRIVTTARDQGIEPLRNWLPGDLFRDGGIGIVNVEPLNDAESESLAQKMPMLKALLFGSQQVQEIARRPFFAQVLARGLSASTMTSEFAPQTELNLIAAWWQGGGYQANPATIISRQQALEELARISATRYGLKIYRSELTASTIGILHHLIDDGLIVELEPGVNYRFSHDIFFEWAFFYLLCSSAENWIEVLKETGEPPVLGRVVEILSQHYFAIESEWLMHLGKIESSTLRTQWQRAWLTGPFSSPEFVSHRDAFLELMKQDDCARMRKLFVWFQAEKTVPNAQVLSGQESMADLSNQERIRFADAFGWPSDFSSWGRLINWIMYDIDNIPAKLIPDVVSVFQVWQNALSNTPNSISETIISQCMEWLVDIEDKVHARGWPRDYGKWESIRKGDELKDLENALRALLLRSTPTAKKQIETYLERISAQEQPQEESFSTILAYSYLLALHLPDQLIVVMRSILKQELPDQRVARWEAEEREQAEMRERIRAKPEHERDELDIMTLESPHLPNEFMHDDWNRLSINSGYHDYYPASPLREPFHSLLKHQPVKGLALIRDISNHAISAWRQLHQYSYERRGTPIPLIITFPWGEEEFWGDRPTYPWFRGWLGPNALESAHMALEHWAFNEVDSGRDIDAILKDVIKGHQSWSVLGIAIAIALETQHVSKITLALLSSQRLWKRDIERQVEDIPSTASNLIGFSGISGLKRNEKPDFEAVQAGNQRPCRRQSLRDLTPLFVLHSDEEMRVGVREALMRFPDDLPFNYEEEKTDQEHVEDLRHTAEIWAEWGKQENYRATENPEDEKSFLIEHDNPKQNTPRAQAERRTYDKKIHEISLWNWVQKTFDNNSLSDEFSLDDAVQQAKSLDNAACFQSQPELGELSLIPGAVAGIAAAVLIFSNREKPDDLLWAQDVIARASHTPIGEMDDYSSYAVNPWHPCMFVTKALAAEIKHNSDQSLPAKEQLLRLAGHPLKYIALAALQSALSCWGYDSRYAWTALELGMRLSIGTRRTGSLLRNAPPSDSNTQRHQDVVIEMIDNYRHGLEIHKLTCPPPAWVQAPVIDDDTNQSKQGISWQESEEYWSWDFASSILAGVPIEKIMSDPVRRPQFTKFCQALLSWTIEKLNPPYDEDEIRGPGSYKSDLFEWQREIARILANVSVSLDANTVKEIFLDPIFSQQDDTCNAFLSSYISPLIYQHILDAKVVNEHVITLLHFCIDRLLDDGAFLHANNGDTHLYGHDLPFIVRDLCFISIEEAGGAARFVNGNWEEIDIVLPLIDKFIRKTGWHPSVTTAFLTLCDRSGACYPVDLFVDQVLSIMNGSNLSGWRATIIPARLAGLIQEHADRQYPLPPDLAKKMLKILDELVNLGDRRSAALQTSDAFRDVRIMD